MQSYFFITCTFPGITTTTHDLKLRDYPLFDVAFVRGCPKRPYDGKDKEALFHIICHKSHDRVLRCPGKHRRESWYGAVLCWNQLISDNRMTMIMVSKRELIPIHGRMQLSLSLKKSTCSHENQMLIMKYCLHAPCADLLGRIPHPTFCVFVFVFGSS